MVFCSGSCTMRSNCEILNRQSPYTGISVVTGEENCSSAKAVANKGGFAHVPRRKVSWSERNHLLQRMGDDVVWRTRVDLSGRGMLTRNTSLARVLFFLEPATPMRASTSAFRSFRIPTQSTLRRQERQLRYHDAHTTPPTSALASVGWPIVTCKPFS